MCVIFPRRRRSSSSSFGWAVGESERKNEELSGSLHVRFHASVDSSGGHQDGARMSNRKGKRSRHTSPIKKIEGNNPPPPLLTLALSFYLSAMTKLITVFDPFIATLFLAPNNSSK